MQQEGWQIDCWQHEGVQELVQADWQGLDTQVTGVQMRVWAGTRAQQLGAQQESWQQLGTQQVGWQQLGAQQVGWQQLGTQQVGWQQLGLQQEGSQQLSGQSSTCQELVPESLEPGRQARLL